MTRVAITGIDGSGKSTLIGALQVLLAEASIDHRVVDKWAVVRGEFRECRFLESADLEELKVCIAEMPLLSRWPFLFWTIAQASVCVDDSHDTIDILDGHWMKHACAEAVFGYSESLISQMVRTLPRADHVILLDIDPSISLERKRGNITPYECGLDPGLDENKFLQHQAKVRGKLLDMAEKEGWSVVDATQGVATIAGEVMRKIQRLP